VPKQIWIVRAGYQAEIAHDLLDNDVIAVGWPELEDFHVHKEWAAFREEIRNRLPADYSEQRVGSAAGQLWAFINEIKVGDYVVSPVKGARQVLVGVVNGEYKYSPTFNANYPRTRAVKWLDPLDWDSVPVPQRNSFFAWQTLYRPAVDFTQVVKAAEQPAAAREKVVQELVERFAGEPPVVPLETQVEDLTEKVEDAIRSRLQGIGFVEFQNLVAAVLKAAGFSVLFNSAGKGKDAGMDLIISRDALGAGEKIIVQVKHQKGAVGQPELQQLVGTLKPNEHGLMICTGGISSDAQRFWRDNRDRLLKPLEAGDFIQLLGDVYEQLDPEFKAMLPLKKAYVPIPPEE